MKKPTFRDRRYIVRRNIRLRSKPVFYKTKSKNINPNQSRRVILQRLDKFKISGVNLEVKSKRNVVIWLPEVMNFSTNFENTALYISAIRYCVDEVNGSDSRLRLRSVRFDHLRKASTSASLVLTSEISNWDDKVNNALHPDLSKWNPEIIQQFQDLGYFDLFPNAKSDLPLNAMSSVKLIRYIKGTCGDNDKPRELKTGIHRLIGKDIEKWAFLHGGLSEAITNVSHHAYPSPHFDKFPKNWYLTASFDTEKRELKISFYDQGIGIPATLPTSSFWEYISKYLRRVNAGRHDALMIRAALAYGRTRTKEDDRGKGLQDMLQFIRQVGQGYLSIISVKGLCKVDFDGYKERNTKTVQFENAIPGTLIIWKVTIPKS